MLHRARVFALLLSLLPDLAAADPLFADDLGANVSWPPGSGGAFHPVQAGSGRTLYVDGANGQDQNPGTQAEPLRTISRALELASAGDTIIVLPGAYREALAPPDKDPAPTRARPLVLRAEPPDGQSVVIDGEGIEPVREGTLQNPAGVSLFRDGALVLDGFRIQNFSGYGLAVQQGSDTVVARCSFSANGTALADPLDVLIISSREVRLWGCRFDGQGQTERGLDDRAADTWIFGNTFRGYTVAALHVGPYPEGAASRIEHNQFWDNPASQGALELDRAKGVEVFRNLFVRGNLTGIRLDEVSDSRILANTVVGFPQGLELHALAGCRVRANIVYGNTVGVEILDSLPSGTLDENLYFNNLADTDGMGGPGPSDQVADPGFVDPGGDDYALAAGAYALDRAPADLDVPQGGGARADLGAFERGAGEPPWQYQPRQRTADLTPLFGWTFADSEAGRTQANFRVQLDRQPTFDTTALIDSNWTSGTAGSWTVPDEFALEPGVWYARVKLQNDSGRQGPWSPPRAAFAIAEPPTCAAQGGSSCAQLDACDGQWLESADQRRCCLGTCRPCPDADQDGHQDSACGGDDCDDAEKTTHPGATEVCDDQKDNDCDGDIDLDDSGCGCIDRDGDGFGVNCPAGPDCDDTIASVYPGAEELCNNTDDDCDGSTDEGFDTTRDPDNCGECGFACRQQEVCDLGECLAACRGGRTDCHRSCIDTASDLGNCGGCGQVCDWPHASEKCTLGQCQLLLCEAGYVDLNLDPQDGCEYACTPSADGKEICGNGQDEDCDGLVDEDCGGGGCGCTHSGGGGIWTLVLPWFGWQRRFRRNG